jgi:hypothetical protein
MGLYSIENASGDVVEILWKLTIVAHRQILAQCKLLIIIGGEGEIRTHGTRKGSTVFETAAFDHSATSPFLTHLFSMRYGLYIIIILLSFPSALV